ncbi:MAG: hypothetical protein CL431_03760 [Acidimicrobiaceae bacterium]|jgi:hypothetical protein|nr:hypothetical protein [Acidimicrobiaceae bacterium]|tara:strand:+ start:61990 stop:62463 length:474 start_codon:yes stop_codon:yes gene_type:complete
MPLDSSQDDCIVESLLGRKPQGDYEIAVRRLDGTPRVIKNAPFLNDGTPMPTTYWLIDPVDKLLISRLESTGAIDEAEREIGLEKLKEIHLTYEQQRDKSIDRDYEGPRPSGGVGGTRKGIKCLHAHYAWFLAGGNDPVGLWIENQLSEENCNKTQN